MCDYNNEIKKEIMNKAKESMKKLYSTNMLKKEEAKITVYCKRKVD